MKINHTTLLSRKELEDIRIIWDMCRGKDGITLSCPEDADRYWLLEEENRPAAFIAVYEMEETIWECYGFTRPDCRNRGYFSALLEQVCQWSEGCGQPDLCLVTDNRCPAALAVLHHLEAEPWSEEHMMEYVIPENPTIGLSRTEQGDPLELHMEEGTDHQIVSAWASGSGRSYACQVSGSGRSHACQASVTCRLSLSGSTACLYSLETVPGLRRQGLATRFLTQLIPLLAETGCSRLRLQVAGSNTAALGLYRKTGFRITETLSYYLY